MNHLGLRGALEAPPFFQNIFLNHNKQVHSFNTKFFTMETTISLAFSLHDIREIYKFNHKINE